MTYVSIVSDLITHGTFLQCFLLVAQEEDCLQDPVHGPVPQMLQGRRDRQTVRLLLS